VEEEESVDIILESVKLASQLHRSQHKKKSIGPRIPYMAHLLEVAGMVQANGGDEATVAAALLHDAIEDQGTAVSEQIRSCLGSDVLTIVEACTESRTIPKPPWSERKAVYIQQVSTASLPVLLVMVSDKLQNSRMLLRRLKVEGSEGWGTPGREEKLRFKLDLLESMQQRLCQLEQEQDDLILVNIRLLIDEYGEVVMALTHY
jgi:GTP pyrophosphokinase